MPSPTTGPTPGPTTDGPGDPVVGDPIPPDAGAVLRRYRVARVLGVGGAGVVYVAHDPDLDRDVAIKLVRDNLGRDGGEGAHRLRREGRLLAQLQHENVVEVFDAGRYHQGELDSAVPGAPPWGRYVVMELVEGASLSAWLRGGERSWQEVVRVFAAAGRGLAAAHAKGLVHRDFKPANALLRSDGRVKVLDFGLASVGARKVDAAVSDTGESDAALTETGMVMGTPRYMAPEQHLGQVVGEKADQYALCVSMFEGLYGMAPFSGDTLEGLARAKKTFRLAPGHRPGVPGWLRRVLERGLAPDPEDRFPSVDALLEALETGLRSRARRRVAGLGVLVALAAASIVLPADRPPDCDVEPCAGMSTADPLAPPADPVAAADVARIRGDIGGLHASIEQDDFDGIEARAQAVVVAARAVDHPPVLAEALGVLGSVFLELGKYAEAEAALTEAADFAEEIHHDEIAMTAATHAITVVGNDLHRHEDGFRWARRARAAARRGGFGGEMVAGIHYNLGQVHMARSDYVEAQKSYRAALEGFEAAGIEDKKTLACRLMLAESLRLGDRPEEALEHAQAALETSLAKYGEKATITAALRGAIGSAHHLMGDPTAARIEYEKVAAAIDGIYEGDHINVAVAFDSLSTAYLGEGRAEDALAAAERAAAIARRVLMPDDHRLAVVLHNLAQAVLATKGPEAALPLLEETVRIQESIDRQSVNSGLALSSLGNVLNELGELDRARISIERALEVFEETTGAESSMTVVALGNLAVNANLAGEEERALQLAVESIRILATMAEPDDRRFGVLWMQLAYAHRHLGRPDEARVHAQRALSLRGAQADPGLKGEATWLLAGVAWDRDDRRAARRLAHDALALFESASPRWAPSAASVRDWLRRPRTAPPSAHRSAATRTRPADR